MAVGGMPEVVATYAQTRSISSLGNLYSSLLTAFHDDVYKYAKESATASIQRCIETVPLIAGTVTSYKKLGGGGSIVALNFHALALYLNRRELFVKYTQPNQFAFL